MRWTKSTSAIRTVGTELVQRFQLFGRVCYTNAGTREIHWTSADRSLPCRSGHRQALCSNAHFSPPCACKSSKAVYTPRLKFASCFDAMVRQRSACMCAGRHGIILTVADTPFHFFPCFERADPWTHLSYALPPPYCLLFTQLCAGQMGSDGYATCLLRYSCKHPTD